MNRPDFFFRESVNTHNYPTEISNMEAGGRLCFKFLQSLAALTKAVAPACWNVQRIPVVALSGFGETTAGYSLWTRITGKTAKLFLLLFIFLMGMQSGTTVFAAVEDADIKKQTQLRWEECSKSMKPSFIDYVGVFVFRASLADSENPIQSLNLTQLKRGNAFADYSFKEEKKGRGLIFEKEPGTPAKQLGIVESLLIKDGYYLCNITEFVPGSMLYYDHQVIIRMRKEKTHDRGNWREMEIMEKIADVFDIKELSPASVMAIIKEYERRKSDPNAV